MTFYTHLGTNATFCSFLVVYVSIELFSVGSTFSCNIHFIPCLTSLMSFFTSHLYSVYEFANWGLLFDFFLLVYSVSSFNLSGYVRSEPFWPIVCVCALSVGRYVNDMPDHELLLKGGFTRGNSWRFLLRATPASVSLQQIWVLPAKLQGDRSVGVLLTAAVTTK